MQYISANIAIGNFCRILFDFPDGMQYNTGMEFSPQRLRKEVDTMERASPWEKKKGFSEWVHTLRETLLGNTSGAQKLT